MSRAKPLFVFSFTLFLFPLFCFALDPPIVVINEIAWMGTNFSYNDEWIELYNNSNSTLNVEGWQLISEDGALKINLKNKILPQSFFLLERTDDSTIPKIKADIIYTGSLNNKGEHLKLLNEQGIIIDEINCLSEWFFGDNQTKQTMERKSPLSSGENPDDWQNSSISEGTPREKNSLIEIKIEKNEPKKTNYVYPDENTKNGDSPSLKNEEVLPESKKVPGSSPLRFWAVLLIAIGIAIVSAIFFLVLKDKKIRHK